MNGIFKNINVVSVQVTDWERAKKFYGETLGLGPAHVVIDEVGWMEFGGEGETHISLNKVGPGEAHPGHGSTMCVFSVDDVHKTVAELRKRGVKCDDVVVIPGMVAYATFYDSEGNHLQVASTPSQ